MATTVSPVLAPDAPPVDHPTERRRVLFVSSSGGHLAQLLHWVTFDFPNAHSKLEGEMLIPAYFPTTRNIVNLARNPPLAPRTSDQTWSSPMGPASPFPSSPWPA